MTHTVHVGDKKEKELEEAWKAARRAAAEAEAQAKTFQAEQAAAVARVAEAPAAGRMAMAHAAGVIMGAQAALEAALAILNKQEETALVELVQHRENALEKLRMQYNVLKAKEQENARGQGRAHREDEMSEAEWHKLETERKKAGVQLTEARREMEHEIAVMKKNLASAREARRRDKPSPTFYGEFPTVGNLSRTIESLDRRLRSIREESYHGYHLDSRLRDIEKDRNPFGRPPHQWGGGPYT